MNKNHIDNSDKLTADVPKSVSGNFVPVRPAGFNPAYEMPIASTELQIETHCGVCFSPVVVDRADNGTFHLCEDCRRAILFLKHNWHEIEELICKSHR